MLAEIQRASEQLQAVEGRFRLRAESVECLASSAPLLSFLRPRPPRSSLLLYCAVHRVPSAAPG